MYSIVLQHYFDVRFLGFHFPDSSIWTRRSTACLRTPNRFPLHNEREFGAIKDRSWIEGNVIMIPHKDRKIKKTKQLGEYDKNDMQITKTSTLNKTCAMKKR